MPLNLASPGIVVREVDLTVGRVDATSGGVGAIVAPFAKGPIGTPILVQNESDLLKNFGEPYNTDKHYEHWMVASSYLAYGGDLRVVRADDTGTAPDKLNNACVGTGNTIKINSLEHYNQLGYDETAFAQTIVAKNPGTWANGLKVALIDAKADQIVGVDTSSISVGYGVTQAISATLPGIGTTSSLNGYLKGIVTRVGTGEIDVKVLSQVSTGGTVTVVDYQPGGVYAFSTSTTVGFHTAGGFVSASSTSVTSTKDWFNEQTITLSDSTISWNTLADRPGTSSFAAAKGGRFDEVHVVLIDDKGTLTGTPATIVEKHLSLSKAKDAEYSVGSPSYWRKYLAANSANLFAGSIPSETEATGFVGTGYTALTESAGNWNQNASGVIFHATGANTLTLANGKNYGGKTGISSEGALEASTSALNTGYDLFENTDNYDIDFLLMGSANYNKENAQALANKLIAVAEARQDALAFISPYRKAFITDTSAGSVTVESDATSSTYAVFDSGYKYMYDRFSDTFRYVPLNGDIAGLCARNDLRNFPWFSPAGTARGAILNAVKLAYNPSKVQRDKLYSNRVNPVIFSPGDGIVLFGDKTGFAKSSAFDRINVRRLFIYLEQAIAAAARDQLFEFNDEITRTNFVNIIEPFLRDVQAKRGIFDYVVVCDETNNTAAVIDNNEFVADIFIKPNRSINFIGLTFVATRTGVSFDEVIGNV
jgi:hypothetical protein